MAARAICCVTRCSLPSPIYQICLGRCAPRALHLIPLAYYFGGCNFLRGKKTRSVVCFALQITLTPIFDVTSWFVMLL
jgi:hypothetical protein